MLDYVQDLHFGDWRELPISTLAFIGDAVYEKEIRLYLAVHSKADSGQLHQKAVFYVSAKAQAFILDNVAFDWNEVEENLKRRALNYQSKHLPPNVDVKTYSKSTAFEALIAYLYIERYHKRLAHLISEAIRVVERK